jgi:hypothetical protein
MLMPVLPGSKPLFGIIQVEGDQSFEADNPVEFPPGTIVSGAGSKLVSGCEHMTGIETDSNGNSIGFNRQ